MKTKKSAKLVIAGLIGCSVCALPLLLPIATGALGASILGFTFSQVLCGIVVLMVGVAVFAWYFRRQKNSCTVPPGE